jgi:hypothetical protein
MPRDLVRPALLLALSLAFVSCQAPSMSLTSGDGVFAVPGGDDAHHRLRYLDGQVSSNDSCMIRLGNRLNDRIPPMYVNGEPVGFC